MPEINKNNTTEVLTRYIPISIALIALIISVYMYSQLSEIKKESSAQINESMNAVTEMQQELENLQYAVTAENSLYLLRTCDEFDEYLRMLRDSTGYTAIVAVKDIQGFCLNETETDILKAMGFDQADTLRDGQYHSFIGISEDGKMIYQQIGGDDKITYYTNVGEYEVEIESSTLNAGNTAAIVVGDVDRSVNNRGFNIVTIENATGNIVDTVAFDTHVEEKTCIR